MTRPINKLRKLLTSKKENSEEKKEVRLSKEDKEPKLRKEEGQHMQIEVEN